MLIENQQMKLTLTDPSTKQSDIHAVAQPVHGWLIIYQSIELVAVQTLPDLLRDPIYPKGLEDTPVCVSE